MIQDFTLGMIGWIGAFDLVLLTVILVSFAVLPPATTMRHYLTTSPVVGFTFMAVSFIIPLSPHATECRNSITPNDWLSDPYCAVSGSLLIYGAWVVILSCMFSTSLAKHILSLRRLLPLLFLIYTSLLGGGARGKVQVQFASGHLWRLRCPPSPRPSPFRGLVPHRQALLHQLLQE